MTEQYATWLSVSKAALEDLSVLAYLKDTLTDKLWLMMQDAQLTLDEATVEFETQEGTAYDPDTGEPYKVYSLRASGWSTSD